MIPALYVFAIGACFAIDGDTLRCGDERVRLARIDAPEIHGPNRDLAIEAKDYLQSRIGNFQVRCVVEKREKYGRLLGECMGRNGSLSNDMLESGLARPYDGGKREKW